MDAPARRPASATVLLTAATLVCFAANSLLCRLALLDRSIDAVSFTSTRILSGAAGLLVVALARRTNPLRGGSWLSASTLFLYAAPFSIAYLKIGAGVGALVLFAAVQVTMIGWGIARGERPGGLVWLGLALAFGGLCGLTLRGASAPDPLGVLAMVMAGLFWGIYSLRGRVNKGDPIAANAGAFLRASLLVLALFAGAWSRSLVHASARGLWLAVASGVLASAGGYSIWYLALPRLTATTAAVVQLLVPVIAATGGVLLLGESVSLRLVLAGSAILGGVALAIRGRR
jgi:drug/metabolite transporter (DMT)-like permease